MEKSQIISKLPEELRAKYRVNRKCSPVIEGLKVAAALKLWGDRGYRNVRFEVSLALGGKRRFVKVLAQDADRVVGVECASNINMVRLHNRMTQLRNYLPPGNWLILVFSSGMDERVRKAVKLADEVWVIGKNGTVEQMMFTTTFHRG
jgi:hypothetical protein